MSGYIYQGINCGNCKRHHQNVAAVKACYQGTWDYEAAEARGEYEAEMAIERYYENRGWEENAAFEAWEQRNGAVDFGEALAAAERDAEADLIRQIRAYAANHYEEGWDVIIEAYEDERLREALGADFGPAMTLATALSILRPIAETWLDVSTERRAAAGWSW